MPKINTRLIGIFTVILVAIGLLGSLFAVMTLMARPETTDSGQQVDMAAAINQMDDQSHEVVATVNGTEITREAWQLATTLDAVMSQIARQPIPSAEETLDRLVNEIIVLDAVPVVAVNPSPAEIEARIEGLTTRWDMTADTLNTTLTDAGLTRMDLANRVARLLRVETALTQLAAQEPDVNAWLLDARTNAEIGLYSSLTPALPETVDDAAPDPDPVPIFAPPADMPVAPHPENAAPDFTLAQLDGTPITLSELRGKPTIINFWATWCPPCRRELPALQDAYDNYDIGFIAVDVKESPDKVATFVENLNLTFPIVLDTDGQISDIAYGVRGLPTTIFVDANGVVSARHVGPLTSEMIDSYLAPLLGTETTPAETSPNEPVVTLSQGGETVVEPEAAPNEPDPIAIAQPFTTQAADGSTVTLADYAGKSNVVMVFYRGHT